MLRLKLTMVGMTGMHLKHKQVPIQITSITTGYFEMKQHKWANINCDETWKDRIGSDISDSDQKAKHSLIKTKWNSLQTEKNSVKSLSYEQSWLS